MTIGVVIADDQALVRDGIAMLLEAEPDITVLGLAGDGAEVVTLARSARPDVVVMDVRMPGIDGIEASRLLRTHPDGPKHEPRVLVVTTFPDDDVVLDALRAGASGFVLKSAAPQELADAVRAVAAGEAWIDKRVAATVIGAIASAPTAQRTSGSTIACLTPREQEVLSMMAQGLTAAEIRDQLVLSDATVKTHVARILSKTGTHDRGRAIALAYREGLVAAGPGAQQRMP